MFIEQLSCPLCGSEPEASNVSGYHRVLRYECNSCTTFLMHDIIATQIAKLPKHERGKLAAVLRERTRKRLPEICVHIHELDATTKAIGTTPIADYRELLAEWPESVPARLDKAFECLVLYCSEQNPLGRYVRIPLSDMWKVLCVTLDESDGNGLFFWMAERNWIERRDVEPGERAVSVSVTPDGWERYEELTRGRSNRNNPAFVAMWFGKPRPGDADQTNRFLERRQWFDEYIVPACATWGWKAKRADTDEHNDPIMDRVLGDIRKAPFVIAELARHNPGVYYEAGYAKGVGAKEVIFCCPEDEKPHFDVSGLNLVLYKNGDDLKKRLGDRIYGTVGEGPHPKKGGEA